MKFEDVNSLATLFAHELGHIHYRHIEEQYTRVTTRTVFVMPLIGIPLSGSNPPHTMDAIMKLTYQGYQEIEADRFA